jgi:hypothetical protein
MKALMAAIMALSISGATFAADLNQTALDTLLSSTQTRVEGDIHEGETVVSIFVGALEGDADIKNECSVVSKDEAKCTLWLTFKPMGETALQYSVNAAGTALTNNMVTVSRGD